MANTRALVKRRKAVRNIRKITRTMELIATARFKKAMDRATEAEAYTRKISELAADLSASATNVKHPLLETHDPIKNHLLQSRLVRRLQRQHPPRGHRPGAADSERQSNAARGAVGQASHRLFPLPG